MYGKIKNLLLICIRIIPKKNPQACAARGAVHQVVGDVAVGAVAESQGLRAVHRVGRQAVEVVVGVGLALHRGGVGAALDEPAGVVGVREVAVLASNFVCVPASDTVDIGDPTQATRQ